MTGGVFLVLLTLVGPIDANLGIKDFATVESLKSSLGSTHVHVLDETVVETAVLVVSIGNNFNVLDGARDGEDFCEHVLGDTGTEVSDVEMGAPLDIHFTHRSLCGAAHTHWIHDLKKTKEIGNRYLRQRQRRDMICPSERDIRETENEK
jgi:hypothetical protein